MNCPNNSTNVMIAGVGGASLGTEICKTLRLAGKYAVLGCDISNYAYGLYDPGFAETFLVDRENYVESVVDVCLRSGTKWLIPGGEEPNALLGVAAERFARDGIRVVTNDAATVGLFTNKKATFAKLAEHGISIPKTRELVSTEDVEAIGLPCIVKPSTGSGGSTSVFFAVTVEEALIYADFIRRGGTVPVGQEYISEEEGEFTIGVLSLADGEVVSSVAMQRVFGAKLSVSYRGRGGLISSGYSQGRIEAFTEICQQAEAVARAIGSSGPINVQGRVRKGELLPFEINPRFSASSYLRALAGVNEIDMYLSYLMTGERPVRPVVKPGMYLRTLAEARVPLEDLK